jgi:hypothetical protein
MDYQNPQQSTNPNDYYYDNEMPMPNPPMPGAASDAIYADYVQEKKIENILAQINPDNLLADIEARIKGYRKDILTNKWIRMVNAPEVSPILIGNFMSFLSAMLNNNTTLSNFRDKEINMIMRAVIKYVVDDLRSNSMIYGIEKNYSERTRVGLIVCATVFTTLKRAQNGMEAGRIFRAVKIGENNNPYGDQKKGGFTESLKFWK